MKPKKEFDFFDKPQNLKKLWIFLYVACALTILPEPFLHKHSYFGFDGVFGFFALLGFFSCAALILFSKLLAQWLKAREDYYDH